MLRIYISMHVYNMYIIYIIYLDPHGPRPSWQTIATKRGNHAPKDPFLAKWDATTYK